MECFDKVLLHIHKTGWHIAIAGTRILSQCAACGPGVSLPGPCHAWLQDGELVTFSEVQGMEKLNGHEGIRVKNCKVGSTPSESWHNPATVTLYAAGICTCERVALHMH